MTLTALNHARDRWINVDIAVCVRRQIHGPARPLSFASSPGTRCRSVHQRDPSRFFDASSSRQFSSRPDNFSLLAPLAYTQRNGRFATSNTSPLLTLWLPNNTPASHQALQRQVKLSVIGATTAEKLEGTSRGVDADFLSFLPLFLSPSPVIAPLLFYPFPSLPFYSFPLKFSKGVWEAL